MVQRALDEAEQEHQQFQAQNQNALQLHALQRKLTEEDALAPQAIPRGGGQALPLAVQRRLEVGLNIPREHLQTVRVHADPAAHSFAKSVNAIAATVGTHIFFQRGKLDTESAEGQELLAHEVTHTYQQVQGKVTGKGIAPDPVLEQEARLAGKRFAGTALDAWRGEARQVAKQLSGQGHAAGIADKMSKATAPTSVAVQRQVANSEQGESVSAPQVDPQRLTQFRRLLEQYRAAVQSGEVTPADREHVEQAVRRAEAAIRHAERVQARGQSLSAGAGMAMVGSAGLAADDVTGIGVADDVAIPFVLLAAGALALGGWLLSSSDASKRQAWMTASQAVGVAVGSLDNVLLQRRTRTETGSRVEPVVMPQTRDKQDEHRGRLQVQGADLGRFPNGELSWAWARTTPPTAAEALTALQVMKGQLGKRELEVRVEAFFKAEKFILKAQMDGGIQAIYRSDFQSNNLPPKFKNARVDIEVLKGRAFV